MITGKLKFKDLAKRDWPLWLGSGILIFSVMLAEDCIWASIPVGLAGIFCILEQVRRDRKAKLSKKV